MSSKNTTPLSACDASTLLLQVEFNDLLMPSPLPLPFLGPRPNPLPPISNSNGALKDLHGVADRIVKPGEDKGKSKSKASVEEGIPPIDRVLWVSEEITNGAHIENIIITISYPFGMVCQSSPSSKSKATPCTPPPQRPRPSDPLAESTPPPKSNAPSPRTPDPRLSTSALPQLVIWCYAYIYETAWSARSDTEEMDEEWD